MAKISIKAFGSPHQSIPIQYKAEDFFDQQDASRLLNWASKTQALKLTDTKTNTSVAAIPHPVNFKDLAMLYHMEATHAACVTLKAIATAGSEYKLINPSKTDIPKEIQSFVQNPNPNKSIQDIIRDGETDFQTTGNAYIEVVPALNGSPKTIVNVISHTVFAIDKEATASITGLPHDQIPDYCQFIQQTPNSGSLSFYRSFGKPTPTQFLGHPVGQIIHLKEYSPMTEDYGLPAILAALNQLLITRLALDYRLKLFQDAGVGPTVFHFEGAESLSPDDEHILQHYIEESIRKGTGKILAIPTAPGVKLNIHKLSIISDLGADMLRELLTPMRDEILRVHRVPPRLVSVADTRGLGGSAEALAQMEQFQAMVINTRQNMWMDAINKIITIGFQHQETAFRIEPLSLRSLLDMQKYYIGWLDRGVLNIDDVRSLALGLDKLPNDIGQVYRINMGGQPVELSTPGPKPGQTVTGIASATEDPTE